MGNTLDAPIVEKDSHAYTSGTGIICGASGMQGWRLEMEDAHVSIDIPSAKDHIFLAVFDGHAGAGAARYAAANIVNKLEQSSGWKLYVEGGCKDAQQLGDSLIDVFIQLDVDIKAHQAKTSGEDTSGCTAVTAVITPTFILCANAGDSRCVMGTNGETKFLSEDHKPYNEIERNRIHNAGGFVQWNRVDGDLAVSRALGDFGYKTSPELPAAEQKVSCVPDIMIHERTDRDDVLLLACDGLWDVMSNEEAIDSIREIYNSGETDMVKIAEEMLDLSLNKGSKDNISAVVVRLPGATFGPSEGGGVDKRRSDRSAAQAEAQAEKERRLQG